MEYLVTGTTTHRTFKRRKDGTLPEPTTRQFPSFIIFDPDNLRSLDAVRYLAWRMIGEPADFTLTIEERIQPPCDECARRQHASST